MKEKFKVRINFAVGLSEDVHCHEFFMEGNSEKEVFKQIKSEEWFAYQRCYIIHGSPESSTVYHEFIQTKHITDICIWKENTK